MSALRHKQIFRSAIAISALPRKRTFDGVIGMYALGQSGHRTSVVKCPRKL